MLEHYDKEIAHVELLRYSDIGSHEALSKKIQHKFLIDNDIMYVITVKFTEINAKDKLKEHIYPYHRSKKLIWVNFDKARDILHRDSHGLKILTEFKNDQRRYPPHSHTDMFFPPPDTAQHYAAGAVERLTRSIEAHRAHLDDHLHASKREINDHLHRRAKEHLDFIEDEVQRRVAEHREKLDRDAEHHRLMMDINAKQHARLLEEQLGKRLQEEARKKQEEEARMKREEEYRKRLEEEIRKKLQDEQRNAAAPPSVARPPPRIRPAPRLSWWQQFVNWFTGRSRPPLIQYIDSRTGQPISAPSTAALR